MVYLMSRIFISYSSKDRPFVLSLAQELQNAGHDVWLDVWNIVGREPYWDEIKAGIESCTHFIYAISPEAVDRNGGAYIELSYAYGLPANQRPVIVPIMVRATPFRDFPIQVNAGLLQIHDFTQRPYPDVLRSVLKAVQPKTTTQTTTPTPSPMPIIPTQPIPRTVPINRASITMIGVGVLVLIAFGALLASARNNLPSSTLTPTIGATNTSQQVAQGVRPTTQIPTVPTSTSTITLSATPTTIPPTTHAPATVTLPPATLAPGTTRKDSKGIEQVWVPAGCFMMGSDPAKDKNAQSEEQPQHEVCLTKGYWIDKYEVTNAAYQQFIADGGYTRQEYWSAEGWKWLQDETTKHPTTKHPEDTNGLTDAQQPRVGVAWYEAEAYARWRNGRLPTEAEWEYAARGPKSPIYPWGDQYGNGRANIDERDTGGKYRAGVAPVGSYPNGVSWIGAYDMVGNVQEWTADWADPDYYKQGVKNDPPGAADGGFGHIIRSHMYSSDPRFARAAARFWFFSEVGSRDLGFRLVSSAP